MNKENVNDLVNYVLETEWDSFEEHVREEYNLDAENISHKELIEMDIPHIYTIAIALHEELKNE